MLPKHSFESNGNLELNSFYPGLKGVALFQIQDNLTLRKTTGVEMAEGQYDVESQDDMLD